MIGDVALSRSLSLSSFPCWERATAADALVMRWVAREVLQPVIDRWGRIEITSWRYWKRNDCGDPRVGDHSHPGTIDFVPLQAPVTKVWSWMASTLRGKYGSLIHERDHIHYTRPGVGARVGHAEVLYEPTEGIYRAAVVPLPLLAVAVAGWIALRIFSRG